MVLVRRACGGFDILGGGHSMDDDAQSVLDVQGLQALIDALRARGHRVVGPRVRDRAIVYDDIEGVADLPRGWTDVQEAGRYRLARRGDDALFGYAVGPQSWKAFLHPPVQRLWTARREDEAVTVTPEPSPQERFAFFGVRACELKAIAVQDRVFLGGQYVDTRYRARREDAFLVAVNCAVAGGTCFCASMNAGPEVEAGYDLALTEVMDGGGHRFVVRAGSAAGREVLAAAPRRAATDDDLSAAAAVVERTAAAMGRTMRSDDLRELLLANLEHPRWSDVADRCLSCGNCTMVCPTCFCTSVEESSDLTGQESSRSRRWESCFTMDYSYIHGGSVRSSVRSRYRQWMTHKLATWIDQFGMSGCVGCGRCVTWCPVGIDITEEVRAIREQPTEQGAGS
jgi:sulfhydrogenase subunit beta (sulfur reductase)